MGPSWLIRSIRGQSFDPSAGGMDAWQIRGAAGRLIAIRRWARQLAYMTGGRLHSELAPRCSLLPAGYAGGDYVPVLETVCHLASRSDCTEGLTTRGESGCHPGNR